MSRQRDEAISELACVSVSKRIQVQNLSYEIEFDLHENEPIGETGFHVNGFARRLVLTQRQKGTRKSLICSGILQAIVTAMLTENHCKGG